MALDTSLTMKQHYLFDDLVFQYRFKQWCVTATKYVGLWNCIFSSCSTVVLLFLWDLFLSEQFSKLSIIQNHNFGCKDAWSMSQGIIQLLYFQFVTGNCLFVPMFPLKGNNYSRFALLLFEMNKKLPPPLKTSYSIIYYFLNL